jgi:hypothetical protein
MPPLSLSASALSASKATSSDKSSEKHLEELDVSMVVCEAGASLSAVQGAVLQDPKKALDGDPTLHAPDRNLGNRLGPDLLNERTSNTRNANWLEAASVDERPTQIPPSLRSPPLALQSFCIMQELAKATLDCLVQEATNNVQGAIPIDLFVPTLVSGISGDHRLFPTMSSTGLFLVAAEPPPGAIGPAYQVFQISRDHILPWMEGYREVRLLAVLNRPDRMSYAQLRNLSPGYIEDTAVVPQLTVPGMWKMYNVTDNYDVPLFAWCAEPGEMEQIDRRVHEHERYQLSLANSWRISSGLNRAPTSNQAAGLPIPQGWIPAAQQKASTTPAPTTPGPVLTVRTGVGEQLPVNNGHVQPPAGNTDIMQAMAAMVSSINQAATSYDNTHNSPNGLALPGTPSSTTIASLGVNTAVLGMLCVTVEAAKMHQRKNVAAVFAYLQGRNPTAMPGYQARLSAVSLILTNQDDINYHTPLSANYPALAHRTRRTDEYASLATLNPETKKTAQQFIKDDCSQMAVGSIEVWRRSMINWTLFLCTVYCARSSFETTLASCVDRLMDHLAVYDLGVSQIAAVPIYLACCCELSKVIMNTLVRESGGQFPVPELVCSNALQSIPDLSTTGNIHRILEAVRVTALMDENNRILKEFTKAPRSTSDPPLKKWALNGPTNLKKLKDAEERKDQYPVGFCNKFVTATGCTRYNCRYKHSPMETQGDVQAMADMLVRLGQLPSAAMKKAAARFKVAVP